MTSTDSPEALKPCPFCADPMKKTPRAGVQHKLTGKKSARCILFQVGFESVDAWNTRALSPPSPDRTYATHHNPNCPSPFQVRLVGKSGRIDNKHHSESGDIIGYGQTFNEAYTEALALLEQEGV